ncbi:YciI family protein [Paraburkholderia oxyphila]|uniref:YciI family protein n=1 Tax=Paraburkholderia oxyphila TaxID=614212 RepID=UPI0004840E71|nr:YciI family protein [Paraburkholderia oxyphila]
MNDLDAILRNMLNKTLYVALRKPRNLHRVSDALPRHIEWMLDAERHGDIFLSGPFMGEGQPGEHGGMTILRAPSLDGAQRLIAADPFIAEGVFDAEVKPWLLMEGSLTCTIRLSNQRASID